MTLWVFVSFGVGACGGFVAGFFVGAWVALVRLLEEEHPGILEWWPW